jgi:hypothetical protein
VRNADAGLELRSVGPQGCEAAGRPLLKGIVGRIERVVGSTPFRPCGARGSLDKIRKSEWFSPRRTSERSIAATRNVWTNESIRQKIIGHRMAVGGNRFGRGLVRRGQGFRDANGAFTLLDEPASDQGIGVFVEPLVEEGRDLLAEIGRVTEAREFVALQGVAGSGEEKLPRRLSTVSGHRCLRGREVTANVLNRTTNIIVINSTVVVLQLWKTVESEEKSARACSGCAGDYEDPDRSAWEEDFEEEEVDFQEEAGDEPGPDE